MDNSPFSKLSAELRNRIYNFAILVDKDPLRIGGNDSVKQPPVTHVCKQIRSECLLMFYAEHDFCITIKMIRAYSTQNMWVRHTADINLSMVNKWLRATGRPSHLAVKTLTISVPANAASVGDSRLNDRKDWTLLASHLKECGYRSPRLQVEIVLSRAAMSQLSSVVSGFWRTHAKRVKSMLCSCGLDAVVTERE